MIRGLLVLACMFGSGAFMVADICRDDTGETTKWVDTWPVQHAEWFGVLTGLTVFALGLITLIAARQSSAQP